MNILILGLGAIGQRYIRILKRLSSAYSICSLRSTSHNQLIADDLTATTVPDLPASLGISTVSCVEQARYFNPTYIIDARPPLYHLVGIEPLIRCAKGIFCEKPLSINAQKSILLHSEVIQSSKSKIVVGYHYVQHPLVQQLKTLILNAKVLRYSFVYEESLRHIQPFRTPDVMHESSATTSGSVLHSLSHAVHLALFLFSSFETTYLSHSSHTPQYLGYDIYGCSDLYLLHSNDTHSFTGFVRCAFDSHQPQQIFTIYTKEITYRLDLRHNILQLWKGHELQNAFSQPITKIDLLSSQMSAFLNLSGPPNGQYYPLVSFDDALATLSLCDHVL